VNPNDPNVQLLETVAARLGEALRRELVFVGGAIAGLLITDPAMPGIRPTDDVDLICRALVLTDYHQVEVALRKRGFVQDLAVDAPICRWRAGDGIDAVAVDVMPTLEDILGFTNRWYPLALETAKTLDLPSGLTIRVISAPAFIATKLEAFDGRGGGDYMLSHDLEDLLAIIDGRASLLDECRTAPAELRNWLAQRIETLLATPAFVESLAGHLPGDYASQARLPDLEATLRQIASMRSL
jgi:hypothetical protein